MRGGGINKDAAATIRTYNNTKRKHEESAMGLILRTEPVYSFTVDVYRCRGPMEAKRGKP